MATLTTLEGDAFGARRIAQRLTQTRAPKPQPRVSSAFGAKRIAQRLIQARAPQPRKIGIFSKQRLIVKRNVNVQAFRKLTDYAPSSGAPEPRNVPFPFSPPLPFGRPPLSVGMPTPVPPSGMPESGGPFEQEEGGAPPEKKGFSLIPAGLAALFFFL